MMKKISFLFFIFSLFGYSQSLPINFDESSDPAYYFTCYDCNFSLTTDPEDATNKVGKLTSYNYAEFGSAQTIDMDQYVDLSNNNNNTITFRIKPMNGTGSGNHMLKFSGGSSPFGVEVRFSTTGTEWQTITANFGSGFRNYRNLIIFPDFQSFKTDVYLIDDIQGASNIAPRPRPSKDAPIPTIAAEKVKGIYGETYTNIQYLYNFAESFREVDIENKGNKALEVDLGYYGAGFKNTDASEDTYVHFDYWTSDATKFALRINSESPLTNDKQYVLGSGGREQITKNTWTSVFIPLTYYSSRGVNLKDLFQYNFVDAGGVGTVFIDNIYFTSESSLSVNENSISKFEVFPNPTSSSWNIKTQNQIISSVKLYNVLGKKIMTLSPNSSSVSIDSNTLNSGLYFAQITMLSGVVDSVKLIKK
jgi:hypothetical protein